jgi:hypothetical protein
MDADGRTQEMGRRPDGHAGARSANHQIPSPSSNASAWENTTNGPVPCAGGDLPLTINLDEQAKAFLTVPVSDMTFAQLRANCMNWSVRWPRPSIVKIRRRVGQGAARIEQILILDFGSQYTQVIARRVRECNVYSTIVRFDMPAAEIAALKPKGLILSGGPSSVYRQKRAAAGPRHFQLGVPSWASVTACS